MGFWSWNVVGVLWLLAATDAVDHFQYQCCYKRNFKTSPSTLGLHNGSASTIFLALTRGTLTGLAFAPNIQPLPPGGFVKAEGLDPSSLSFQQHWSELLHWLQGMTCSWLSVWPEPLHCTRPSSSTPTACIFTYLPTADLCLDTLITWENRVSSGTLWGNPGIGDVATLLKAKYLSMSIKLHCDTKNLNDPLRHWVGTLSIAAFYAGPNDQIVEEARNWVLGQNIPSWCTESDLTQSATGFEDSGRLPKLQGTVKYRGQGNTQRWEQFGHVEQASSRSRLGGCNGETTRVTQALRSEGGSMALVIHITGFLAAQKMHGKYCIRVMFPRGLRPVVHLIQCGDISQVSQAPTLAV
eukprot:jgi/Botrbrau1/1403/Bobra.0063s0102.2